MVNLEHVKIVKQSVNLGTNKEGSTPPIFPKYLLNV